MSEPDKILYITLHSKDAQNQNGMYRFQLTHSVDLHGFSSILSIVQFQCLNNIPNIQEDLQFFDKTLTSGFYTTSDLQKFMTNVLRVNSQNVNVFFDTSTLTFKFFSDSEFTLTGSLLLFLGFPNETVSSTKIIDRFDYESGLTFGTEYFVSMNDPIGIYKNVEYIHVLNRSLQIESHRASLGDFENEILKIPISVAFGSYIVLNTNDIEMKSIVYNKLIQNFEMSLTTDLNKQINTSFTMTIKIEMYDDGSKSLLNKNTTDESKTSETQSKIRYLKSYNVIRQNTGTLKDARTIYEENLLNRKKKYLLNHPFHQFTEEEIDEMKNNYLMIKKALKKKKNSKN